jgi:hypothetical protein
VGTRSSSSRNLSNSDKPCAPVEPDFGLVCSTIPSVMPRIESIRDLLIVQRLCKASLTAASGPRLIATEVKRLSSRVEQLLNKWEQDRTVLKIELSSKYMSVFGEGIVSGFKPRQELLLDSERSAFRVSLSDASWEVVHDADSVAEHPRLSESEIVVGQIQISLPENHRLILGEILRAY